MVDLSTPLAKMEDGSALIPDRETPMKVHIRRNRNLYHTLAVTLETIEVAEAIVVSCCRSNPVYGHGLHQRVI